MMCAQQVREALAALSGMSEQELDAYHAVMENAMRATRSAVSDSEDERCAMLAAARAYYDIQLAQAAGGVTSFQAGDVRFTLDGSALERAKTIYENAMADCSALMDDNGFAFRTV